MGTNWDTLIFKYYHHLFQADQKAESDMKGVMIIFLEGIWKLAIMFHGNNSTTSAHISKDSPVLAAWESSSGLGDRPVL